MIQAKELRKGNFLMTHEVVIITGITKSPVEGMPELASIYFEGKDEEGFDVGTEFNPILLTEEILLSCGCDKYPLVVMEGTNIYDLKCGVFHIRIFYTDGKLLLRIDGKYIDIKYLHQLQNLYFALTGEDLKIELQNVEI